LNKTKLFWEQKAGDWGRMARDPGSYYTRRTFSVLELICRYLEKGKALDVGCGAGLLSLELAKRGFDVYGTDVSENMVHKAVQKASSVMADPKSHFRVSIEGEAPFDFKFDVITAIGVFPYVENYDDYLVFLSRQLAKDGYLMASCTKNISLCTAYLIVDQIMRFHYSKGWRGILMNLMRTGVWSGGYVNYHTANQCYNAPCFDNLFYRHGFQMVNDIDLFHVSGLDRNPLNRKGLNKWFARYLGWNHVGMYKKQEALP
jgi:SAM-dependent methyltransferase